MTKKSSKCSVRMILYTLIRALKQDRDQFQDSVEGNCFDFFLTVSNYSYFCERRGVFQYNLHNFQYFRRSKIMFKQLHNGSFVSIFKINLEDTMHQHFEINHVKRKLQKYKTMFFIKKKLKSTMWCQVNKLFIFQFHLKQLFYRKMCKQQRKLVRGKLINIE